MSQIINPATLVVGIAIEPLKIVSQGFVKNVSDLLGLIDSKGRVV